MARVYSHDDIVALTAGTVPVINGLSDKVHPCQVLADLQTLYEAKDRLKGVTLAYVGDGNNMSHSLMIGCAKAEVAIRVCTPPGYEPDDEFVTIARAAGGDVTLTNDPNEACEDVDAVYTDVWASMGQEEEAQARRKAFADYQVNEALFDRAGTGAVFLHCLPAHRGEEVTDGVVDHPQSMVLDQAENRLHAQKALMIALLQGVAIA